MSVIGEFRDLARRGAGAAMAVGVIIGLAFSAVVTSFVNDILMPPIGFVLGNVNFSDLYLNLGERAYDSLEMARAAGAPVIAYGAFLNALIGFFIAAWAVFLFVKAMNADRKKHENAPGASPSPPRAEVLLEEIRDALKPRE